MIHKVYKMPAKCQETPLFKVGSFWRDLREIDVKVIVCSNAPLIWRNWQLEQIFSNKERKRVWQWAIIKFAKIEKRQWCSPIERFEGNFQDNSCNRSSHFISIVQHAHSATFLNLGVEVRIKNSATVRIFMYLDARCNVFFFYLFGFFINWHWQQQWCK